MIHSRNLPTHLQSPECASEGIDANAPVELVGLRRGGQQMIGKRSLRLGDVANLVILAGTGIQRPAEVEFSQNAAQGPHVDRLAVRQAQQNLRSPANIRRN